MADKHMFLSYFRCFVLVLFPNKSSWSVILFLQSHFIKLPFLPHIKLILKTYLSKGRTVPFYT